MIASKSISLILAVLCSNAVFAQTVDQKLAALDAATGAIHLFFPRTAAINLKDKEVLFATRFGSMKIEKRFRLKDMTYRGKLEL